jgi:hypothetical protein
MKGGPSLVVRWDFHVGARDFCPALAALVGPVLKIFFPHCTLFQFICPRRPQAWQAVAQSRRSLNAYLLFRVDYVPEAEFMSIRFR